MKDQSGIDKKLAEVGALKLCEGEAHLQNSIASYGCYICGKEENEDMVLIRTNDKEFSFACLSHEGVMQEFLRQYQCVPLGYKQYPIGETNAGT